jgi:hypothetical protein
MTTVLKLGGELLEDAAAIKASCRQFCAWQTAVRLLWFTEAAGPSTPSFEREARNLASSTVCASPMPRRSTLSCAWAGRNNTALVAAIVAAGGRAVDSRERTHLSAARRSQALSRPCQVSA